ncbi:unnamed protein product [Adineta steineri]|uniref:Heparan-alpha-glucosaminide N-acetyltransferase catalytic domain-containing protein n=1 Tax=Adineta steineri TaxID=433720 RepID=A0A818S7Q9_9BILA|nr:unnamed protein product [Adineta steineri]
MYTNFYFISIIQLLLFQTSISIHFGHEVGSSSMDSTHYDRRICSLNNEKKELNRASFWATIRSSPFTMNNTNQSNLIPFRRQLIINNGEDRLVTRSSPSVSTLNTTNINNSIPLGIDQASVDIIVNNQISDNLTVYVLVNECLDCPYEIIAQDLSSTQVLNLTLNTKYTYQIRIELNNVSSCVENLILYEHGEYILNVQTSNTPSTNSSSDSGLKCLLTTRRLADNVYTPLIFGGVILIAIFIFCIFAQRMKLREYLLNLKNRCFNHVPPQESTHSYDLQACPPVTTLCQSGIDTINTTECNSNVSKILPMNKVSQIIVPRSKRLLSLDAFRGFALIAMIFVNYGGGGYAQFEHSSWHGITFADTVFPIFVWILGASLVFSLKNAFDKGVSKRTLLMKVAMRTLKLFIIGFILNTRFKVDLNNVRILGVLQRFAIVYGIIGTIEVLCTRPRQYSLTANLNNNGKHTSTITTTTVKTGRTKRVTTVFRDISNFPLQWLSIIGLTTIWILVVYLVPFENCPAGYLGPGGLHENGKYENCTGGITGYIDRFLLTDKHLYQYPSCQLVYGCKPPFDPENLLGVIPTIFLAYLGVQAGRILVMYQSDLDRLIRLITWSIFTTAIGVGLTSGTLDGGPMPLNKNLWTLSFSFFTAGLAFLGFSIMYIIIDKLKWWNATPFQYLGTNSILIYIAHIVFATYFPIQWVVANTHAAYLAMALWGCIFWIIIAYIFFKKRIFLVL